MTGRMHASLRDGDVRAVELEVRGDRVRLAPYSDGVLRRAPARQWSDIDNQTPAVVFAGPGFNQHRRNERLTRGL